MRHLSKLVSSRLVVLAALLVSAAGCSTLNQIDANAEGPAAMGGLRYTMARWSHPKTTPGDHAAMIFDFPLSFALDVALLPFSGINEIVEGGIEVKDVRPAVDRPEDHDRRK